MKTAQRIKDTSPAFKKVSAKKVAQALGGQEFKPQRAFYVIAMENPYAATGNEYFGIEQKGNHLLGFHNPRSAYQFSTISDAREFIEKFVTFSDVKIIPIAKEIIKFDNWVKSGCLYRSLPVKNPKISKKYNGESKEDVLKWHIAYAKSNDFEISQDDYESWPGLYQKFKHLHSVQAFEDGTVTFEFMFPKSGGFCDFKKELDLVMPYCTCKDGTGKLYHVFDHYLSENGNCVSLVGYKDGSFCVKSQYSILVSGTLEDCFEYLKKERWYGD